MFTFTYSIPSSQLHILTLHTSYIYSNHSSLDGLHHARVPELPSTQLAVKHKSLLVLVWLDAAHKEWFTLAQCGHEGIQGALELYTKCGRLLAGLWCLQWRKWDGHFHTRVDKFDCGIVTQLEDIYQSTHSLTSPPLTLTPLIT